MVWQLPLCMLSPLGCELPQGLLLPSQQTVGSNDGYGVFQPVSSFLSGWANARGSSLTHCACRLTFRHVSPFCSFQLRHSSCSPLTSDFFHFSPEFHLSRNPTTSALSVVPQVTRPGFQQTDLPFHIGLSDSTNHLDCPSRVSFLWETVLPSLSLSMHMHYAAV